MHIKLAAEQIYVAVDLLMVTVKEGALGLLLSQRGENPFMGRWALPGRFVGREESAARAVDRLLDEMLPLPDVYYEQLYTFTDVNRDPRGRVISISYLVAVPWERLEQLLRESATPMRLFRVQGDGEEMRLLGPDGERLTAIDMAFDHGAIIDTGVRRLAGKIDYTDIGFRFLQDDQAFSLSELQQIFEAVLRKPLDGSNFRRFIRSRYEDSGRIEAINQADKRKRGRPAALYRWHK